MVSPRLGHRHYAEHGEDRGPAGIHSSELSRCEVLAYAHGHILNDMCAACWFTYLLVFLESAVGCAAANRKVMRCRAPPSPRAACIQP